MTHSSLLGLAGVLFALSACSGEGERPPPIGDAGTTFTPPVIIETGGRGSTGEAGTSSNGYSGSLTGGDTSFGGSAGDTSLGGSAGDTSFGGRSNGGDTSLGGTSSAGTNASGGTGDVGTGGTLGSGGP